MRSALDEFEAEVSSRPESDQSFLDIPWEAVRPNVVPLTSTSGSTAACLDTTKECVSRASNQSVHGRWANWCCSGWWSLYEI